MSIRCCFVFDTADAVIDSVGSFFICSQFLALVVFTVIKIIPTNQIEYAGAGDLPMLAVTKDSGGSMGFEGVDSYDISKIINNNPWTENTEISTLPVYKNLYDENDKVKELLKKGNYITTVPEKMPGLE